MIYEEIFGVISIIIFFETMGCVTKYVRASVIGEHVIKSHNLISNDSSDLKRKISNHVNISSSIAKMLEPISHNMEPKIPF